MAIQISSYTFYVSDLYKLEMRLGPRNSIRCGGSTYQADRDRLPEQGLHNA